MRGGVCFGSSLSMVGNRWDFWREIIPGMSEMPQLPAYVVRIFGKTGIHEEFLGSGVVLSGSRILTCRHVCYPEGRRKTALWKVSKAFFRSSRRTAGYGRVTLKVLPQRAALQRGDPWLPAPTNDLPRYAACPPESYRSLPSRITVAGNEDAT